MNSGDISLNSEVFFNNFRSLQSTSTLIPTVYPELSMLNNTTTVLINCTGKKVIIFKKNLIN